KPRQRPAPMLAAPRVLVPEEPVEPVLQGPVIEAVAAAEVRPMVEAVLMPDPQLAIAPIVETMESPFVEQVTMPIGEAISLPLIEPLAELAPAAGLPEDAMALPPVMDLNLLAIESDFEALSEGNGGDAWILGLEPLPVVEELPMSAALAASITFDPVVHEHRPVIAEGAPLPDMIEISVEPAPQGLQMAMTPFSAEPRMAMVNEGPIEPVRGKPVVTADIVAPFIPDEAPLVIHSPVEAGALKLFEGFAPAASVDHLAAIAAAAEKLRPISEGASFEVSKPQPESSEPITLRPMPRVMASPNGESLVSAKRNAVFGMPLPLASVKSVPNEEVPAPEPPRRIIPHAPASTAPDDQQKSWLNWWK
ncbi:MAG: hypothetical protein JWO89_813, partial [Verrucomicrobiaceae bacterium]|nr:hypothetical protein [Verrucomicrobiaceae bacterium]